MITTSKLTLPAPAKLNLMLHITGQRADGYHDLQTLFQFLDYSDQLHFEALDHPEIELITDFPGVDIEDNLITRAARLLQQQSKTKKGARIAIEKIIPMGGGLGGGSSNAATTLVGLNKLWHTGLSLHDLASLGLQLGADVPVFIHGHAAWAQGVGEHLEKVTLTEPYFLIINPQCHIGTAEIFSHKELTRNTSPITIATALKQGGRNDCESVVKKLYPPVKHALEWLNQFADAKMTGTGSSLFAGFLTRAKADQVLAQLPLPMTGFIAKGLNLSPLHQTARIHIEL
jgi:4-diphosphocytidyl-2-C-methyl-D-erythritol kinase